jgi:hypothetical protein
MTARQCSCLAEMSGQRVAPRVLALAIDQGLVRFYNGGLTHDSNGHATPHRLDVLIEVDLLEAGRPRGAARTP